jgi:hypothetical protein
MNTQTINRRMFLETAGTAAGVAAGVLSAPNAWGQVSNKSNGNESGAGNSGKTVALVCDPADAIVSASAPQWALGQLENILTARGISVRRYHRISDAGVAEFCIVAASTKSPWLKELLAQAKISLPNTPEALALASAGMGDKTALFAVGTDSRGLMYALLEVGDRIAHSDPPLAAIESQKPIVEQPANAVRSIARLFVSDVEDTPWFRDKSFWEHYFTMLAAERFNRFSLTLGLGYDFTRQIHDCYFHFAYPFFLAVPGFDVRAVGLPDAERDENLAQLRFISEAAVQRGLDFQLGLWTHAYQWTASPQANYTIAGLNDDNHAAYCREALSQLLADCPAIGGVTIRTHGESGVPEGSYEFWETIFKGAAGAGRKVEIDLHAKGIDQRMIEGALATGMPINVSPKFWAEHTGLPYHQASIRATEMPTAGEIGKNLGAGKASESLFALSNGERRFMRYSYGDLLREDRGYGIFFRMWPGTQRLLLWGDPQMAAAWGRSASFCGSQGAELCEPLSFKGRKGSGLPGGRNAYQDASLKPAADWEKYAYTYRLWGRLLYNPNAEPEVWRRKLQKNWGAAALDAEQALANASRILPLVTSAHLPSAANANYWPELYTNMSIVDAAVPSPYSDTPSPKRFGTVSPLDPALFSTMDEYAQELLSGQPSGKYSPAEVAAWLDEWTATAAKFLTQSQSKSDFSPNLDLRRATADVAIQIALGRFFAHKFRAAVLFAIYERSGTKSNESHTVLEKALKQYQAARDAWTEAAKMGDTIYVSDITFGPEKHLRGCWSNRLAAIDQDVERMAKLLEQTAPSAADPTTNQDAAAQKQADSATAASSLERAVQMVLSPPKRVAPVCQHKPPISFHAGNEMPLALTVQKNTEQQPEAVRLHYRQVNQAEKYETLEMKAENGNWTATIPASYTQSPFPLQYFFEVRLPTEEAAATRLATLFPGLDETLCNQPYFVVRQG